VGIHTRTPAAVSFGPQLLAPSVGASISPNVDVAAPAAAPAPVPAVDSSDTGAADVVTAAEQDAQEGRSSLD